MSYKGIFQYDYQDKVKPRKVRNSVRLFFFLFSPLSSDLITARVCRPGEFACLESHHKSFCGSRVCKSEPRRDGQCIPGNGSRCLFALGLKNRNINLSVDSVCAFNTYFILYMAPSVIFSCVCGCSTSSSDLSAPDIAKNKLRPYKVKTSAL